MTTMSCSAVTVKYLLFLFNLLFVLTGIVFIAVGVSVKGYYSDYKTILDSQYFSAPNFLIAIGVIIFVIAFFGCCGAIKQNYCMIVTFTALLVLIFIFEFSAGIAGYVLRGQTEEYLQAELLQSIQKYEPLTPESSTINENTIAWDEIQEDFKCCGAYNSSDWQNNKQLPKDMLPLSCCHIPPGSTGTFECNITSPNVYKTGCTEAFGAFVEDHAVSIGGVAMGFAVIQILGIVFAWYLSKQVKIITQYA